MMNMIVRHSKFIDPCGDFRTSARLARIVRAGETLLLSFDKYETEKFESGKMPEILYAMRTIDRKKYWKAISNIARYAGLFK